MTRLLKSAAGLLRTPDGAYYMRPDTSVTVPTITLIGQATISPEGRFLQSATVPSPPDGWTWVGYRKGERPFPIEPGSPKNIDVGPAGEPPRVTTAYLVAANLRVSRGQPINANFPSLVPFVITGVPSITTAGYVGAPFSATFPTVTFGTPAVAPVARIDLFANATTATIDSSVTSIPTTVPPEWAGKFVRAYWSVIDPATNPTLREFASARTAIVALTTAAPLSSDITILRSVYRPDGQTDTYSPIFILTDQDKAAWQIRFRAGPVEDTGAAYGGTEFVPGTDAERRLSNFTDPLFPGQNFALFRVGEARNQRLRFSWRPNDAAPWSGDSPLFSVPAAPVTVQPFEIEGTPAITTTGQVGAAFSVTWPVIVSGVPAVPPVQRLDLFADATTSVIQSSTTTIPTTVPSAWSGLHVRAYWSVNDPGTTPTLREFVSPRLAIAVGATPPPLANEITILRGEFRPTGQTTTYSPIFTVAAAKAAWQVRFRSGPTEDVTAAYGNTEANPGSTTGERRLSDFTDPAFPGQNFALYRPGEARNNRLRFSWRPNSSAAWSSDGVLYSVPQPVVIGTEIIFGTAAPGSASDLMRLVRDAPAGTSVVVPPGTYARCDFGSSVTKTGGMVRVRAEFPNNPPVIRSIDFGSGRPQGIFLDGLSIIGNTFDTSNPNFTGDPGGTGIDFSSAIDCRIENCKIQNHKIGVQIQGSTRIYIGFNEFSRGGMDTIRALTRTIDVTIEHNNFIANPNANLARAAADLTYHMDHLQMDDNSGSPGSLNMTIQDNKFTTLDGYHQNFYLASQKLAFVPNPPPLEPNGHRNTIIRRNRLDNGWAAGIWLSGHWNFLIEDNLLRQILPRVRGQVTQFVFAGPNAGRIRNNVYPAQTFTNQTSYRNGPQGIKFWRSGNGIWGDEYVDDFILTGNVASATAFPVGWREPIVGPYQQAAAAAQPPWGSSL